MNADNFADYLAQPAKLYQLPYQEIKNLVAEYPYSANLRLLMALKSKLENDPKFDQYVHQLAAHTIDRGHLQYLLEEELLAITDLATDAEERLELKALEELQQDNLVKLPVQDKQEEPPLVSSAPTPSTFPDAPLSSDMDEAFPEPNWPSVRIEEEERSVEQTNEEDHSEPAETLPDLTNELEDEPPRQKTDTGPVFSYDPTLVKDLAAVDKIVRRIAKRQAKARKQSKKQEARPVSHQSSSVVPAPLPHSSFSGWQQPTSADKRDRFRKLRKKHHDPSPAPKLTARKIAKQSVKEAPGLVSETLARLLAEQGQHSKAIKMYKRLSLLFPEKSRYFAGIIKNLKQNS